MFRGAKSLLPCGYPWEAVASEQVFERKLEESTWTWT